MLFDVFICHASEDKDRFVRPLAESLRARHLEVWFDEFSLAVGDSIRRSIDHGLIYARFGVVVLSPAFFAKNWPQYELDALIDREMSGADRVLLPVWLDVDHKSVSAYSPALANRHAALASRGLDAVVSQLAAVVRPEGSPLIIARDTLLQHGVHPPVITSEYWLDVVEASNRLPGYGPVIPQESTWDRWSFPLPQSEGDAVSRGERLAWTALQLSWTHEADREEISVTTRPEAVLNFIDRQPGLRETSEMFVDLIIEYAPQLTIPGFAGELEPLIEAEYRRSLPTTGGRVLGYSPPRTVNRERRIVPQCNEEWALRHEDFGGHSPAVVAGAYFRGGMFGPRVALHDDADHLVWLLSDESSWLPEKIRRFLREGLASSRASWPWMRGAEFGWNSAGAVQEALFASIESGVMEWTPRVIDDWRHRIAVAQGRLQLPEESDELLRRVRELALDGKLSGSD